MCNSPRFCVNAGILFSFSFLDMSAGIIVCLTFTLYDFASPEFSHVWVVPNDPHSLFISRKPCWCWALLLLVTEDCHGHTDCPIIIQKEKIIPAYSNAS